MHRRGLIHKDVKPAMAMAFNVACLTASIKALVGAATLTGFTVAAFTGPRKKTQPASASMVMAGSKRGLTASAPTGAQVTFAFPGDPAGRAQLAANIATARSRPVGGGLRCAARAPIAQPDRATPS